METVTIDNQKVIISGIGKLFYQQGLPVSMSIKESESKGFKVSLLHIADECLKHGWTPKTTFRKLKEDFADSGSFFNVEELEAFCFADYEEQREMIFKSLFTENTARSFLKSLINS